MKFKIINHFSKSPVLEVFRDLYALMNPNFRFRFYFLIFLSALSSIFEIVTLALVYPLINSLFKAGGLASNLGALYLNVKYFQSLIDPQVAVMVFLMFFTISTILRMVVIWFGSNLSFGLAIEIGNLIFFKISKMPYEEQLNKNSSEFIDGVTTKIYDLLCSFICPIIQIIPTMIIVAGLTFFVFYIDFRSALVVLLILGGLYGLIIKFTKNKLAANGVTISKYTQSLIKNLQELLSSSRDIILNNSLKFFYDHFQDTNSKLRTAHKWNYILGQYPRLVVEFFATLLLFLFLLSQIKLGNNVNLIYKMGFYLFFVQRILPLVQSCFQNWAYIHGGLASSVDCLKLTKFTSRSSSSSSSLDFKSCITLDHATFRYQGALKSSLSDVTLRISKGDRVGVVGRNGAGKTTLIDVLSGLLPLSSGYLKVDDQVVTNANVAEWQKNIAYVPQSIFILDANVRENIALNRDYSSISVMDDELVLEITKGLKLHEKICYLKDGYNTILGEGGNKLSGGQRQLVGIARALYTKRPILILDEASSALDLTTEIEVMDYINKLGVTLIMITHRPSTLDKCNKVFEVNRGSVIEISHN